MQQKIFKNLLSVYSLLVCFVLVFIILISLIFIVENIIKITLPKIMLSEVMVNYESNGNYKIYVESLPQDTDKIAKIKTMSEEELSEQRIHEREYRLKSMQAGGTRGLITASQWLFFSLLFFIIHWFIYKKQNQDQRC